MSSNDITNTNIIKIFRNTIEHKYLDNLLASMGASHCDTKHQNKQLVQLKEVAFPSKPAIYDVRCLNEEMP